MHAVTVVAAGPVAAVAAAANVYWFNFYSYLTEYNKFCIEIN